MQGPEGPREECGGNQQRALTPRVHQAHSRCSRNNGPLVEASTPHALLFVPWPLSRPESFKEAWAAGEGRRGRLWLPKQEGRFSLGGWGESGRIQEAVPTDPRTALMDSQGETAPWGS